MTPPQEHANRFVVKVEGAKIKDEVAVELVAAFVDDNLHLPDMFQLTFRDQYRTVLKDTGLKIGSKVSVTAFDPVNLFGVQLIEGEVTSLEAEYDPGGSFTTIRGLDKAHRLFRGRVTMAYKNMTYSDVVRKVLQRAQVPIGTIDAASPVHDLVTQANVSDWHFLKGLAAEVGYELGCVDGKFNFRKPGQASKGPKPGTAVSTDPLQLVLGQNLLRFRSTVSAAEQVSEVQVRGWDVKKKEAVLGKAAAKTDSAQIGITPAEMAAKLGNPKFVSVHTPFGQQKETENMAKALANQIAGAFVEMEGVARGNPDLRAGTVVSLGLAGPPFDGKYVVTSTRHTYNEVDGYTVFFTVSGQHERSLLSLVSGNGSSGGGLGGPGLPVYGVAVGIVTKNEDPEKLGRVQVKLPWLDDKYETFWARIAFHGAGKDRGMVILPEVNDEVLVAFEHGDTRMPYLLGGLYNGKDKPDLGNAGDLFTNGKVNRRGFVSSKGHKIVFLDKDGKSGVMVATKGNKFRFALNETKATIRIISDGKLEIEAKQDVMITTKAKVSIDAKADVTAKAMGKMELKAVGGVTIDGSPGEVVVKGTTIKLN